MIINLNKLESVAITNTDGQTCPKNKGQNCSNKFVFHGRTSGKKNLPPVARSLYTN